MNKFILLAALVVATPTTGLAGDAPKPMPTCKSPMAPGDQTYAFRDIRLLINPADRALRVYFCVATDDRRGIADSAFRISVFKKDGAFVISMPAGPISYPVPPISNPQPGNPANIIPMEGAAPIDPALAGALQPIALVQGRILPCKEGPGGPCKNGPDTAVDFNFLLPTPPIESIRKARRN